MRTGLHIVREAPPDEATLIERARAGDRDAQEALMTQHLASVYALALRVLGDRDLAQDATQDAMINALNGLSGFRGEASFRTWLLRIAANSAKSTGRRRTRRREVDIAVVQDHPSPSPDPAALAATRAEAGRALELLDTLPTKQRMAVDLRINQGLSYAEIGVIIECSEGAARVNYHLGIKRLREMLT